MNELTIKEKDEKVSYEELLALVHEAYSERLKENIVFTASSYSLDNLKQLIGNGHVFCAFIDNVLVGTATLLERKKGTEKYGYITTIAVKPNYGGKKIGYTLLTKAIEMAKKIELPYVVSTTATSATSSCKLHKKVGFKIIGFDSHETTNFYSYVFRLQIKPSFLYNSSLFCKLCYIKRYIIVKLFLASDGKPTRLKKWIDNFRKR